MKAKFTKKAKAAIFAALENDNDFKGVFLEHWKRTHPNANLHYETHRIDAGQKYREILGDSITSYLYDGEYLDKKYLDASYLTIQQYGRTVIIDLDEIYALFKDYLQEQEQLTKGA